MQLIQYILPSLACVCGLGLAACDADTPAPDARSPESTPLRTADMPDASNTANNRDDTARNANTSMDQSESSEHLRRTADIRREVIADDTLSTTAKNCKIITDGSGTVWLRGPVDSENERSVIGQIASRIAGQENVRNELEIDRD